jgi:signal transduction histidine kinase/ActR/RegA family two-component response regulator
VSRNPLELPLPDAAAPPVVIHTPTGRDATLVAELLASHGYAVERTDNGADLARRLDQPTGAVVVADEALELDTARILREYLAAQPSWSDLPIIVLTTPVHGTRPSSHGLNQLREAGNITLLERPVRQVTLLSAVQAALRARARQYQVQTYLEERARTEEEVRRRQRIEAVGKLAGGVAHEVNNMMTAVLGFSDMALRQLEPDHPAAADLREVIKAGGRTARITQQLLAFSRQQPNRPELLSLTAVVQDLGNLLQQSVGATCTLRLDLPDQLPLVRADRTQVDQVIINLVLNARDACPSGGTVSLSVATVDLDGRYRDRHADVAFRPGSYVLLAVSDTGRGMDRETMDRAFEPFYTTKPVGQGTGLGLSTVYGIIKQAGGYVWLYSEPGHGTTVKVYLPAQTADAPAPGPAEQGRLRGSERILVVEDEEMVRRIARRALEEFGYEVVEASDGQAALDLLERLPEPPDLILCDIVMPGLSGPELGAALAERAPGVRLLYMSGYPGSDVKLRQLVLPSAPFIQKPFGAADLAAKVRTLLDRSTVPTG